MHALPDCHSRRPWDDEHCFCAHPQVHVRDNLASPAICRVCTRWRDPPPPKFRPFPANVRQCRSGPCQHLGEQTGLRACSGCRGDVQVKVFTCLHPDRPEETTIRDCRNCDVYERRLDRGGAVYWGTAVVSSHDRDGPLQQTLDSLDRAGFGRATVVRGAAPAGSLGREDARQASQLGPWPTWYLALTELYLTSPHADAYLLVPSGALLGDSLRNYLEAVLWPSPRVGVVSLSGATTDRGADGFVHWQRRHENISPAGLVFPGSSMRSLLVSSLALNYEQASSAALDATKPVQHAIARWLVHCDLDCYWHQNPLAALFIEGLPEPELVTPPIPAEQPSEG